MRDMSNENENTYSSSSSSSHLHRSSLLSTTGACNLAEQDDFSLFLHQILLRSSSASANQMSNSVSTQVRPQSPNLLSRSALVSGSDRLVLDGIVAGDSSSAGLIFTGSGDYFPGNVSSSVEEIENNDLDEYDCESEEGLEALVEEATIKQGPARSSSKRSRAAEVHNLSEKRRRSRINEKMKALQNLIPNSNKTDKASMLDEAIEYLKQLQLQVQMLSMRNGLRLLPMSPGILQPVHLSQTRTSFGEENGSFHMNMIDTLSANQEVSTPNVFSLPNRHAPSNLPSVPNSSQIIDSETSFGLESSILAHLGSFQLQSSSVEICKEDKLLHQQLDANHSEAYPLASLPISIQAFKRNHSASMGSRILRQPPEGVLLDNMEQNQVLPSHLSSMHGRRCSMADDMKIERP